MIRVLGLVCAGALVAGCAPVLTLETAPVSPTSRATISAEPAGTAPVAPSAPVVVRAAGGRLAEVRVAGPKGPVPGEISEDRTTWTANASDLGFGATYRIPGSRGLGLDR